MAEAVVIHQSYPALHNCMVQDMTASALAGQISL